jgi:uroporphyrinogen-III synthase
MPDRHRLGSLVRAVAEHFESRAVEFDLGGARVQLRGRLAIIGGAHVELAERERDVLVALAGRAGVVASKQELLAEVWENDGDAHVVEVTVARLRRRLGAAGDGIETIVKRGYRLAPA